MKKKSRQNFFLPPLAWPNFVPLSAAKKTFVPSFDTHTRTLHAERTRNKVTANGLQLAFLRVRMDGEKLCPRTYNERGGGKFVRTANLIIFPLASWRLTIFPYCIMCVFVCLYSTLYIYVTGQYRSGTFTEHVMLKL